MNSLKDTRNILFKNDYDVVVVGGGIAGVAAAVAASRNGAKTVIIEKQINLGGLATGGLINWYEPLCDGNGNQLSKGIAEELLRLSIKYGFENLPKKWGGEGRNYIRYDRFATYYSPTIFSLALDEYCKNNNVELRFDTMATYPVMENNICQGIIAETISGKEYYQAKIIIDATGSAVICKEAGIPTIVGENWFSYIAHGFNEENIKKYSEDNDMCKMRTWYSCGADMYGNGNFEGKKRIKCENSDDENYYIQICKEKFFEKIKSQEKNKREISMLTTMPQFRTIRRIVGDYTFIGEEDGVISSDSIGECGDFRTPGKIFNIPFSCLYNSNFQNIFAVGRIISAEGDGWEVTRVIPVCATTGEAAGVAAAICSKNNCKIKDINIKELQNSIRKI